METVHLRVRDGQVEDAGSWVYVWVRVERDDVLHVGATGLPPAVRTWLHLHHDDPSIGRIADRHPDATPEPLDVLAFRVPDGVERAAVKVGLVARLQEQGLLATAYVGDPPQQVLPEGEVARTVDVVLRHLLERLGT